MTLSASIQKMLTATAVISRAGATVVTCDSSAPWPASNETALRYEINSPRQAHLVYMASGQAVREGDLATITESDATVHTLRVVGIGKWRELFEIVAEKIG